MLKGSIPAIITPFSKGEVDFDSFAKLLKWQIKEGISGVTVCGTTGESPTLTHDCLLYTSPSPRDKRQSRMPSSA